MMMLKGQGVELLNRVKKFNELLVKQRMEYMRKAQAAFGGGSIELKGEPSEYARSKRPKWRPSSR